MTIKKMTLISILFCCTSIYAGGPGGCEEVVEWQKVVTLSGGTGWARGGETQTDYLLNGLVNTYLADKGTSLTGTGELFFAVQWPFTCNINSQFGIAIGGSSEARMDGNLFIDGFYSGSDYVYRTNHSRIALRGKMLADSKTYFIQPYITASIGVAFNNAYGYETMPLIDPSLAPRWFDTNTTVAFTYSAGAGIEKRLNKFWTIGIGYEFSDWGKSGLGLAINDPWAHEGPHLTHIYEQRALFSISYMC